MRQNPRCTLLTGAKCIQWMSMHELFKSIRTTPSEIRSLPRSVKMISAVMAVYYMAWGLLFPFLPIYFHDILGSYAAATLVSALLSVFSIIWIFPIGEFLDRFSQKKVIGLVLLL
jgi:MFS family permease